jgi:hypothetical protein
MLFEMREKDRSIFDDDARSTDVVLLLVRMSHHDVSFRTVVIE